MPVSWPGTTTWASGGTPTAADFNTYISQAEQWIYENRFDSAAYGVGPLQSFGTTNLTLTTSWQNIAGGSVTLNQIGTWMLFGTWHFRTGGAGRTVCKGQIAVNGTALAGQALFWAPEENGAVFRQEYVYTTAGTTDSAVVQARMDAGGAGGTVITGAACTGITAYCWKAGS